MKSVIILGIIAIIQCLIFTRLIRLKAKINQNNNDKIAKKIIINAFSSIIVMIVGMVILIISLVE